MPPSTYAQQVTTQQTSPLNFTAITQYDTAVNSAEQEYNRTWQALQALAQQIDAIPVDQRDKYSSYPAMVSQQAVLQRDMANSADNLNKAYLARASAIEKIAQSADPDLKARLDAQTKLDMANAGLVKAQATAATARTPIDATNAVAALKNAQANADRTATEIQSVLPAQAANLSASAQEATARATSLVPAQAAAAYAQAAAAQSQVGVNTATAEQTRAQTTQLLPAQVEQALSSAGLNDAQKDQIRQAMNLPKQITQGLDQPNLVFQGPNGEIINKPNSDYQAAAVRMQQNRTDALAQLQGMIEKNQISPLEAQSYMDAINAQYQSAMRGTTPFAEAQQRQNYTRDAGGIGRDILNNRVTSGADLAKVLISSISGAADKINVPFDFKGLDPFAMAKGYVTDMGGGPVVNDTASKLVQALLSGVQQGGQPGRLAPDGLPDGGPPQLFSIPDRPASAQGVAQPAMAAAAPDLTPRTFGLSGRYG